jgi:hypothetical protein
MKDMSRIALFSLDFYLLDAFKAIMLVEKLKVVSAVFTVLSSHPITKHHAILLLLIASIGDAFGLFHSLLSFLKRTR